MLIHKLDKELAKLSALKADFNTDREEYLMLQRKFNRELKSYAKGGDLVFDEDIPLLLSRVENQEKMKKSKVWNRYKTLEQASASGAEFTKLRNNLEVVKFKHFETLIRTNDNLVDWMNFDKLEASMKNNPKWTRYKEIKEKSTPYIRDEDEAREFWDLMRDADVERMINAVNFRKNMGPYSYSLEATGINRFTELTADTQYRLMETSKNRAKSSKEYQRQHTVLEMETHKYLAATGRPKEKDIAVKDLVNFVEAIDKKMLIQNNENGLSLVTSIEEASATTAELFTELPMIRTAKGYCLKKCIASTQAISVDITMDAKSIKLLSSVKVNSDNSRSLLTATDFSEALLEASKHLYFIENMAKAIQSDFDVVKRKAGESVKKELGSLGIPEAEIERIEDKFVKNPVYQEEMENLYGHIREDQKESALSMREYYNFKKLDDTYVTEEDAITNEWYLKTLENDLEIEKMELKFI